MWYQKYMILKNQKIIEIIIMYKWIKNKFYIIFNKFFDKISDKYDTDMIFIFHQNDIIKCYMIIFFLNLVGFW